MATSPFETAQYSSENFVESAGAILFKISTREICLVTTKKGVVLLAKGRRNVGESRQAAALREAKKETGFTCQLLPVSDLTSSNPTYSLSFEYVTMTTRAPPAIEVKRYADVPRVHRNVSEPFMVTHRLLSENDMKIIWWYIAAIDEETASTAGESTFNPSFYGFDDAVDALTFESDRLVVKKAIETFEATYGR